MTTAGRAARDGGVVDDHHLHRGGIEAELDQGAGQPGAGIVAVLAGIEHDPAGARRDRLAEQAGEERAGLLDPDRVLEILDRWSR